MMETASKMEIFQLLSACVGLAFGVLGFATAILDARSVTEVNVDPRWILALANVRRQVTRIVVHAMLVLAGSVSVALPPPPPLHDSTQSVVIHVILVIVTVILTFDHVMDRRSRIVFLHHPNAKPHQS